MGQYSLGPSIVKHLFFFFFFYNLFILNSLVFVLKTHLDKYLWCGLMFDSKIMKYN